MSRNDGGPAFPVSLGSQHDQHVSAMGLSIRDYFAAAALQGLCAAVKGPGCEAWDYYSRGAYAIADTMLAERSKTEAAS